LIELFPVVDHLYR